MEIQAFFSQIKNANAAVNALKEKGIKKCFVDLNDHYQIGHNAQRNMVGTETAPSLSNLVLTSGEPEIDPSIAPLAAASPMVSGMGNFEEVADLNFQVKIDAAVEDRGMIEAVIKEYGGDMEDLNPALPKKLEEIKMYTGFYSR